MPETFAELRLQVRLYSFLKEASAIFHTVLRRLRFRVKGQRDKSGVWEEFSDVIRRAFWLLTRRERDIVATVL